jgi:hypothetical protein
MTKRLRPLGAALGGLALSLEEIGRRLRTGEFLDVGAAAAAGRILVADDGTLIVLASKIPAAWRDARLVREASALERALATDAGRRAAYAALGVRTRTVPRALQQQAARLAALLSTVATSIEAPATAIDIATRMARAWPPDGRRSAPQWAWDLERGTLGFIWCAEHRTDEFSLRLVKEMLPEVLHGLRDGVNDVPTTISHPTAAKIDAAAREILRLLNPRRGKPASAWALAVGVARELGSELPEKRAHARRSRGE